MTFEEFQSSMRLQGSEFADLSGFEHDDQCASYRVYGDTYTYIEKRTDGTHLLFIDRSEWIEPETSLIEMERMLFDWVRSEGLIEDAA